MGKEWKNRKEFTEACPNCGNEIDAPAKPGEIRKCPFCRRRYIVRFESRNRKYLEAYIKIMKESDEEGNAVKGVCEGFPHGMENTGMRQSEVASSAT